MDEFGGMGKAVQVPEDRTRPALSECGHEPSHYGSDGRMAGAGRASPRAEVRSARLEGWGVAVGNDGVLWRGIARSALFFF